jgi:hypothetical protein
MADPSDIKPISPLGTKAKQRLGTKAKQRQLVPIGVGTLLGEKD